MVRQQRASGFRWEIPSGGQEAGETLEQTAAREVQEETGVRIRLGSVVCTFSSYREDAGTLVLGAIYSAELAERDPRLIPQRNDGIVAAEFVDPFSLPGEEMGRLTALILRRWWLRRWQHNPPFHVELWRDPDGYHRLDSNTGELRPIPDFVADTHSAGEHKKRGG